MFPIISVIIPSYNRLTYLHKAINSVLSQDFKQHEIIVVFDGGNKKFYDLTCLAFSKKDNITFIYKDNGGVASALNVGIKKARGKFIAWLSDDDKMASNHLSLLYSRYMSEPYYYGFKKTIVYSGWRLIDKYGNFIDSEILPHERGYNMQLMQNCCLPLFRSLIHGCSMLIEKRLFTTISYFREDLITTQDYHLWYLFFTRAHLIYAPGATLYSRIHTGQTGNTLSELHLQECNELWTFFIDNVYSIDEKDGYSELTIFKGFYDHLKPSSYKEAYCHLLDVSKRHLPIVIITTEYAYNSEHTAAIVNQVKELTYNEMFIWVVAASDGTGLYQCQYINGADDINHISQLSPPLNLNQLEKIFPEYAPEYLKQYHSNVITINYFYDILNNTGMQ